MTCPTPDAQVIIWVGLDGISSGTVEQGGSAARCVNGIPVYQTWYEMFPSGPVFVFQINPGDMITASVHFIPGINVVNISVIDSTLNRSFTASPPCPIGPSCLRNSAEWIAEAPGNPRIGLADYGDVLFHSVQVTDANGVTDTLRSSAIWERRIIDEIDKGTTLATTGGLSTDGRNFRITWQHA